MMLSERMKAVAALVPQAECLADVGTDHGYLPISLVQQGRVKRAVAMDVNEGPLLRAAAHIGEAGLGDRIGVRLSDGLTALERGEAGVILIAGMGGPLTVRILKMGRGILEDEDGAGSCVKSLVLQPQSEIGDVRSYISGQGWKIFREDMVLEDGKFYPMMEAERGQEDLTELQLAYGPRLLEERDEVLLAYLKREEQTLRHVAEGLGKAETGRQKMRLIQVEKRLDLNDQAQRCYR